MPRKIQGNLVNSVGARIFGEEEGEVGVEKMEHKRDSKKIVRLKGKLMWKF